LHVAASNGAEGGNDKDWILCTMHVSVVTVKKLGNVIIIS